ncbi:MAG TPA: (2Fe-2S)-binding protein, partial [Actinomycetota bacterium]|nr:(2Fe-2S)-binding protein [Actinomycetota bacterium]
MTKIPVSITVNGRIGSHEVEPRLLLVHYLREQLALHGVRVGCDTSSCGACAVLLNGRAIKSCTMFAVQADGSEVLTLEGLAMGEELHPIQESFWAEHALQCGFCTSGFIMAAYALLAENPNPSPDEIKRAISGNLCRCTGYVNIERAIETAA